MAKKTLQPALLFFYGLGDGPSSGDALGVALQHYGSKIAVVDIGGAWREPLGDSWASSQLADELIAGSLRGTLTEPCVLIGHSAGALVAMAVAERISTVVGLILLEGSLRAGDSIAVGRYLDSDLFGSGQQRLIDDLEAVPEAAEYRQNVVQTHKSLFHHLAREVVQRIDENRHRLVAFDLPVLYVAGSNSSSENDSTWRETGFSKNFRYVKVTNSGHWVHKDAPEAVAGHIASWIAEIATDRIAC